MTKYALQGKQHIKLNILLHSLYVFLDVGPDMGECRSVGFIISPTQLHQFSYCWGNMCNIRENLWSTRGGFSVPNPSNDVYKTCNI